MSESKSVAQTVTPEKLISDAIDALRKEADTDTDLLDILADNIVKLAPADKAVADATAAIEALASKRAEGAEDDPADHD